MKRLILVLVLGGLLTWLGLRLYRELSVESMDAPGKGSALLVETATVRTHTFETNLELLGELKPQAVVEVMSRISGRLREVLVDRGDPVRKELLLAIVDDVDLLQQIHRAEASIAVAAAAVSREEATYENLKIQVARYRELHQENLIATQDLEDLVSRMRVSQAQLELVRAQVRQAEASLSELKIQHDQTRIYSPLNGFVGMRHLEPGALVNPSVPIVSVLNLERVKTLVPVSESGISRIRVGLRSEIVVDVYPDRVYQGSITRISPYLNPETRSADVEIEIVNRDGTLKPGMFAHVRIDAKISETALSIPRSALLSRGAQQGVYFLTRDRTTVFREIQIGRIEDDVVEVLRGLQEGAQIVSTGAQNLNDGDEVRAE